MESLLFSLCIIAAFMKYQKEKLKNTVVYGCVQSCRLILQIKDWSGIPTPSMC